MALRLVVTDPPAGTGQARLRAMMGALESADYPWLHDGQVNLKLVDDAEMAEFNKQYSGINQSTDVLAFSYLESGGSQDGELGDIIISLQTAHRQAEAAGIELAEEVATLALHGLLHILGFDHQTAEQRAAMDQLQAHILQLAGITYRDFNWQD